MRLHLFTPRHNEDAPVHAAETDRARCA